MKPLDEVQQTLDEIRQRVGETQPIVDRLQSGALAVDEVRSYLDHPAAIIRVNALRALAKHAERDPDLLEDFVVAATDPRNNVRLMGTITVAQEAVAWLLRIDGGQALDMANRLIESWADADRDDLLWHLNSEGLLEMQETDQQKP